MPEYRAFVEKLILIEIDVEADSEEEASKQVEQIMSEDDGYGVTDSYVTKFKIKRI